VLANRVATLEKNPIKVVQEQQRAINAPRRQLDLPEAIAERSSHPIVPSWQRPLGSCPAMLRRWVSRVIRI
jgi:hypothetical protein